MKTIILSMLCIASAAVLSSCGATQGVTTKSYVDPVTQQLVTETHRFQNTGVLNEADNFVQTQTAPDGTLLTQAATRVDNKAVVDSWWMGRVSLAGITGLWRNADLKTTGDAAAQLKGTVDPQAVPGSAQGAALLKGTVPGELKVAH
jgi:hypothetical protein